MSNNSNTQFEEELNDKEEFEENTYTLHRGDTVIRDEEE